MQIQGEATSSKNSEIRLMPMPDLEEMPEAIAEKERSSPPPILRRRRNTQVLQQRTEIPENMNQSDYLLISQQQQQSGVTTPSTPIKQLPFSPSQFLNSLSPETSPWPRASTPKGSSPGPLTTPQPTGLRRSQNGKVFDRILRSLLSNFIWNLIDCILLLLLYFCHRWEHTENANTVQKRVSRIRTAQRRDYSVTCHPKSSRCSNGDHQTRNRP